MRIGSRILAAASPLLVHPCTAGEQLHPSMSSKALLVALRAILSPKFWRKVVPCEKLADLHVHCSKEDVVLPDFVAQYEKELVSVMYLVVSVCPGCCCCALICAYGCICVGVSVCAGCDSRQELIDF